MRINEIIKERRLAKGFTQEQIANYLGGDGSGCQ